MSARNGDKARFGKQRKRKMAHRARTVILLEGLKEERSLTVTAQSEELGTGTVGNVGTVPEGGHDADAEHPGVLGSAAESIGSALGSIAAKVRAR